MKVILIFAMLLSGVAAFGQNGGGLSGAVTQNKLPVAGAKVEVTVHDPSGNITTTMLTDASGRYEFKNLRPGSYMVIAEGERGKGIAYRDSIVVAEGRQVALDLVLGMKDYAVFESSIRFSETVTVSAGATQPVEQVSKTVNVIDGQEMRDRADFTLAESLRTIPGLRVQQLGGFGRTATIKTRGLRNQDTAILMDGIRFRDPSAITGDASPFLSDFTLTSVSKIEVLRGSGSSLYGTNAIGGTVDFQTPRPASGTHGQISGAFGGMGLGRFRGNISHGLANGKFGVGAAVSRTAYTKGIDGQDNANNTNFQARVEFNPFSKTSISGRVFVSDARVRLNVGPDTFGELPPSNTTIITALRDVNFVPDANDPDSFQKSNFFSGQLVVNQVVNSKFLLSGYYQGLTTKRRNDDGPLGPGYQSPYTSIFEGTVHTLNTHVNWTPVRENELTAGYEFESERFGNDGSTPGGTGDFFTRAFQSSNTFYVQDLVSLFERKLQLSGAFRSQSFSLDRPRCSSVGCPSIFNETGSPPAAYTGDASAAYYFENTGTKLRVHVGNGYRAPSLYERFGSYYFMGAFFPLGNPELKPERSVGYDGGIEQDLAKGRIRLTGTYFYTKINDEISYLPTDDFGASSYFNFDKHFARGVEFSGSVKPAGSTDIFVSYTFTNSDVRNFRRPSFSIGEVASSDRKAYGIPDHQFTIVVTQRFKRFWVNFDLLATSNYLAPIFSTTTFGTYIYRFAGNRKGDLTAGYTFGLGKEKTTLRLYGTIENLFDQEYFENGFRTSGRTGRFGMSFGF